MTRACLAGESLALDVDVLVVLARPDGSTAQHDGSTFTPDQPGRYVLRFADGSTVDVIAWPSEVLDVPNVKRAFSGDDERARIALDNIAAEAAWWAVNAAMGGADSGLNQGLFGRSTAEQLDLRMYGGR